MSLGTFEKYEEAQKLVDTLSDKEFPVQNCLIVGTDLKQLERITGRLTWGRVLLGGALSGIWLGLFVGLIFALFAPQGGNVIQIVLSTVLFGALFGLAWAAGTYALTGGQRDFSSVSLIVPSKYEVLVEHKFAQQARDILGGAGLGGASHGTCRPPGMRRTRRATGSSPASAQPQRRESAGTQAVAAGLEAGDPGLDVVGGPGHRRREVLVAVLGDQDVVLDAHADAAELLGRQLVVGLEVQPGLHREDHAGP